MKISIWGNFPEWHQTAPGNFLWHDTVDYLSELGSILLLMETAFQVEGVSLNKCDTEQKTYIIDVRPYIGPRTPNLVFCCEKT